MVQRIILTEKNYKQGTKLVWFQCLCRISTTNSVIFFNCPKSHRECVNARMSKADTAVRSRYGMICIVLCSRDPSTNPIIRELRLETNKLTASNTNSGCKFVCRGSVWVNQFVLRPVTKNLTASEHGAMVAMQIFVRHRSIESPPKQHATRGLDGLSATIYA